MRKLSTTILLVVMASILITGVSMAGDFPEKPVTYVVHTGPGDGADIFARNVIKIAEDNNISMGEPVYVQNKPGGSGIVAFMYVKNQEGSPYYLIPAQNSLITRPLTHGGEFKWDDFTMIANLVVDAKVIVVNAKSDFENITDLKEKANSTRLTLGGGLQGGSDSLVAFNMTDVLGGDIAYVPFGGGGEALTALLGNDIDALVTEPAEVLSVYKNGDVRIIGIASDNRNPSLPDVPTLPEQGYDVTIASHRGIAAPGNLPEEDKTALIAYFKEITETDDWQKFLKENKLVPSFLPGEEFEAYMAKKEKVLVPILKEMGLIDG